MKAVQRVNKLVGFGLVAVLLLICGCDRFFDQRKQRYYRQGVRFYNVGNYSAALLEFSKARAFDPKYFDALYMGGMCYYQREKYDSAIDWFSAASSERPDNVELMLKIIECHFKLKSFADYRKSLKIAERLLKLDEDNIKVKFYFAKASVRLKTNKIVLTKTDNFVAEAFNKIDELLRIDSGFPVECLLAELYAFQDKFEKAEDLLFGYGEANEDWVDAMLYLARCYEKLEYEDKQVRVYEKLIEQVPDSTARNKFRTELAALLRRYGKADKEEAVLKQLVEANPGLSVVRMNLLRFYIRKNRVPEAEKLLSREIEQNPDNFELKRMMIDLHADSGDLDEAFRWADKVSLALAPDSKHHTALKNITARLYFQKDDYEKSRLISKEVIKINPKDLEARFNLCKITILTEGASLSVLGDLRLLIRDDPDNPDYYYYLGLLHEMMQEESISERYYIQALKRDPTHREALLKLSELLLRMGGKNELAPWVDDYLVQVPEDTAVLDVQKKLQ